jgi:WD40 repeat protein
VAISPDGRRIVSASVDETLKQWDPETGRELSTMRGHVETVSGVALSPDGRLAVSASWDHTLKVWDLETARNLRTLTGHSDRVSGVAVGAGGRNGISASADKSVLVWDLHSGAQVAAFTCDSPAYCCAIAGGRVLAGDQAGRVHILASEPGSQTAR